MDLRLVPLLRCPACSAGLTAHPFATANGDRCETGVLVCGACAAWYPIDEDVLDLLPEGRTEPAHRTGFFAAYRSRLEGLGLREPAPLSAGPEPGFAAQAHQREHFDDLALREDEFSYGALGRQPFQVALRRLVYRRWLDLVSRGSVVLDLGCANGISTFDILPAQVTGLGLDLSRESLLQAARRARSQGLAASFFVGDADAIAIADAGVECVLCFGSLHHVPDPPGTLAEVARVLAPGGLYLGVENHRTPLRPLFDLLMRWRPLWREEAGAEAQIGANQLGQWTAELPLELSTRATVFVPPHLCNRLSAGTAERLIRGSDAVLGRLPWVRRWGGLIEIEGRKR